MNRNNKVPGQQTISQKPKNAPRKRKNGKKQKKQQPEKQLSPDQLTKMVALRIGDASVKQHRALEAKSKADLAALEKHNARQMEKVILSTTAPKEFDPVRLGAADGSMATAVANPWRRQDAVFRDLGNGVQSTQAFIFRDPRRALLLSVKTGAAATVYDSSCQAYPVNVGVNPTPIQFRPFKYANQGIAIHGDTLYPGKEGDGTRTYVWITQGSSLSVLCNISCTISAYRYSRLGVIESFYTSNYSASASYAPIISSAATDGYYGLDIYNTVAAAPISFTGTFRVTYLENSTHWAHLCLKDFPQSEAKVSATRHYASSIMLSNYSAPIYRQGKIAAYQIPQGRAWWDFIGYDNTASARMSYGVDAVNGYYGFLKPTQQFDFNYIENCECVDGAVVVSWFNLDTPSDFLTCVCQVTDPTNISMYWTQCSAIEYRTDDQWRVQELPRIGGQAVEVARTLVSRLDQHHENPLHLDDIINFVKKAATELYSGIKTALPYVAEGALTVGKLAAMAAPLL